MGVVCRYWQPAFSGTKQLAVASRAVFAGADMEDQLEEVTKEKLIDDLKVVAKDVEELLRVTANQTGDKIAAARTRAEESLRAARVRMNEASDEVSARARVAATTADEYVHANPWQAVGIAAGIGFVVGYLLGQR